MSPYVLSFLIVAGLIGSVVFYKREEIVRLYNVNTLFHPDKIVRNFSRMHDLFHTNIADRGSDPISTIPSGETIKLSDEIEEWIKERGVTSILVLKSGEIRLEEYYRGTCEHDRRISWSMSKSYLSVLLGILVDEGHIGSVDDQLTDYAPQLKESAYEGVTILDALQMMTGVAFNEDYHDFFSDINRMGRVLALGQTLDKFAASLKKRDANTGEYWNYNSIDTHVLGMVIRGATGRDITSLIGEKIFAPLGLEKSPYLLTDGKFVEFVSGGICQTTRDFARYGLMIEQGGVFGDQQVVPADWLKKSVTPSSKTEEGERQFGYHWYIPFNAENGVFFTMGIYGQFLFIDQNRNVVIVITAADPKWREMDILQHSQQILMKIAASI